MVIKIFTFSLFAISLWAYFLPVESLKDRLVDKDAPVVIFEEPFMYTIDTNAINRTIQATYAVKYKTREEMLNADIFLKNIWLNL